MGIIRKQYTFYGSVQGVGFRYRAYYAAREYNVTGWVRNEPDGSVTMQVEGTHEDIEAMLLAIEKGHYVRIENFLCKAVPLENSRSFEIRN